MTPAQPPYYAVIFSSQRTGTEAGYAEMAELMERLAREQPGYLDVESVRSESGEGITVSYWASREAIAAWIFDVYLQARMAGKSDAEARGLVMEQIKSSEEWRRKHPS